jgi:hypothetical protein
MEISLRAYLAAAIGGGELSSALICVPQKEPLLPVAGWVSL